MMDGPSLLIVEDEVPARRSLSAYLARGGYRIDEAGSVRDALRLWDAHRADAVLLDLGLPDRDGLEVIRHIRRESSTPIIVLSARGGERDRIAGLDAGADDYLAKPFSTEELLARIRAVLRRSAGPDADGEGRLVNGCVLLDPVRRQVTVGGSPVHLSPREYELLKALLSHPGRVLTKGRLLRAVWGVAYSAESQYLHVYVNRLRRKLAAADPSGAAAAIITTEPGVGYRVAPPPADVMAGNARSRTGA